VRSRGSNVTEFREFQDGELIAGTRYRVLRLIGVGGMGSVYEVEHVELGKRFVLKALLRELARREDLAQRLRNEWRALARLQHANIVNVTDAGTSGGGVPFYVMERLDGDTLAAHLKQKRRLHVLEAVSVVTGVLEALSAAHDIGIIHRDVKPANIFLISGGGVKLLDFGIAKIADATSVVTARGLAVGTPRYMSPEQARGERVDGRSDLYASGLILFEMIAGVGPFDDARDANELLLAHLAREAPALSSLVMGVAPELEQIVASMLAKDCRARPVHARVVAQQLRDFCGRYQQSPATDVPTVRAGYGAPTVAQPRAHLGRNHEQTTRPEGVIAGQREAEMSVSDAALTRRIPTGAHTTQTTLTANSVEPFTIADAPNTTCVSPPSFDGSTTLEMSAVQPAPGSRSFPTPSPQSTQRLLSFERVDPTEMLGDGTPAIPPDAVETRTGVPLAEVARPGSLTPPPVVDTVRADVSGATAAGRIGRWLALGAAAIVVLAVGGVALRQGSPKAAAGVARAPALPVAEVAKLPVAEVAKTVAPPAAAPAPSRAPAPPAPSALAPAALASAAGSAPPPANSSATSTVQRLNASLPAVHTAKSGAPLGVFLKPVPSRVAITPAAPQHPALAMPGSGL
jgi:serine/threonine protein kinase